jgi:uncharacterized protein (DUF1697 family)
MPAATSRYAALLRAINVGGHTVKMEALRKHFAKMGFANVQTLIASGNVLFDAQGTTSRQLEALIAMELERILGYPVATFVRTGPELATIVRHEPFPRELIDPDQHTLYVGFLGEKPGAEAARRVAALRTPVDALAIHGRELYWGCRTRFSETQVKPGLLDKALGIPMTVRNITTVRKLAAKLA